MENRPGESNPEDGINLYVSSGTAASPIVVEGNRIRGGGPSTSGGGTLLGDGGKTSAYQISRFDVLADPGQYGTAVAGGSQMTIEGNVVYARQQAFTNVGIYAWDQYASACSDVTVKNNRVDWTSKNGTRIPGGTAEIARRRPSPGTSSTRPSGRPSSRSCPIRVGERVETAVDGPGVVLRVAPAAASVTPPRTAPRASSSPRRGSPRRARRRAPRRAS